MDFAALSNLPLSQDCIDPSFPLVMLVRIPAAAISPPRSLSVLTSGMRACIFFLASSSSDFAMDARIDSMLACTTLVVSTTFVTIFNLPKQHDSLC